MSPSSDSTSIAFSSRTCGDVALEQFSLLRIRGAEVDVERLDLLCVIPGRSAHPTLERLGLHHVHLARRSVRRTGRNTDVAFERFDRRSVHTWVSIPAIERLVLHRVQLPGRGDYPTLERLDLLPIRRPGCGEDVPLERSTSRVRRPEVVTMYPSTRTISRSSSQVGADLALIWIDPRSSSR